MCLLSQILDHVEERRQISTTAVFTFLKAIVANHFPKPVSLPIYFYKCCFVDLVGDVMRKRVERELNSGIVTGNPVHYVLSHTSRQKLPSKYYIPALLLFCLSLLTCIPLLSILIILLGYWRHVVSLSAERGRERVLVLNSLLGNSLSSFAPLTGTKCSSQSIFSKFEVQI